MDEIRKLDVIVDTCSRCGGIWLDKGELDALRMAWSEHKNVASEHQTHGQDKFDNVVREIKHQYDKYQDKQHKKHEHDKHWGGHKKKKNSLLDILDMLGR
jgi:Zn-finger nucleic acid-binding protein